MSEEYEALTVNSREEWRSWLESHHASAPGLWLTTYKKGSGRPHLPYSEIVEEAIAWGWVDSRPRKLDAERSQLLLTPRRPASRWSGANKRRVDRLKAQGLMRPSGLAAVEVAQANGAWTVLDEVEQLVEHDDLRSALDADRDSRRNWDGFPPSSKRTILEWIAAAKKPETRRKRISETVRLAAENVRANHWRQPNSSSRQHRSTSSAD